MSVSIKTDDGYFGNIGTVVGYNLGVEDHGIFGINVTFDLQNGSTQGTGWFSLANSKEEAKGRPIMMLRDILEVIGVDEYSKIRGKTVLCLYEDDSFNAFIKGIQSVQINKKVIFKDYYDG